MRLTTSPSTLQETTALVGRVRSSIGAGPRLTGFSLADLISRAWRPLADVLGALKASGVDAVAEAPVDVVTADDVAAAVAAGLGPATLSVQRWAGDGRVA